MNVHLVSIEIADDTIEIDIGCKILTQIGNSTIMADGVMIDFNKTIVTIDYFTVSQSSYGRSYDKGIYEV